MPRDRRQTNTPHDRAVATFGMTNCRTPPATPPRRRPGPRRAGQAAKRQTPSSPSRHWAPAFAGVEASEIAAAAEGSLRPRAGAHHAARPAANEYAARYLHAQRPVSRTAIHPATPPRQRPGPNRSGHAAKHPTLSWSSRHWAPAFAGVETSETSAFTGGKQASSPPRVDRAGTPARPPRRLHQCIRFTVVRVSPFELCVVSRTVLLVTVL